MYTDCSSPTIRVDVPVSGPLLTGWSAWDMPCGCRMASSADNMTLRVRCSDDCDCFQCRGES